MLLHLLESAGALTVVVDELVDLSNALLPTLFVIAVARLSNPIATFLLVEEVFKWSISVIFAKLTFRTCSRNRS